MQIKPKGIKICIQIRNLIVNARYGKSKGSNWPLDQHDGSLQEVEELQVSRVQIPAIVKVSF